MTLLEFFDKPSKWTKGTYCRSKDGKKVPISRHHTAACFCLEAGICVVEKLSPLACKRSTTANKLKSVINELFPSRAKDDRGVTDVFLFNDHPDTTFEDVRKVIKLAGV